MRSWQATIQWDSREPVGAELTVDVGSLEVVRGEGGLTPLSGPEKILVRRNALRSLDVRRFPRITFVAKTIEKTDDGYRLTGTLTIHGKTRPQVVDVRTDDQGDELVAVQRNHGPAIRLRHQAVLAAAGRLESR